jgi:O-antigen/teichoic acid export membrane protein
MSDNWNKIKNGIIQLKDISILSSASIITNFIGGLFWIYMASLMGPEEYGQISYFISIALIVASISLFGAGNSLIVFVAKGEKIQSLFFIITITTSIVGSIILFLMFENFGMSIYAIGFVIFTLVISDLLGKKLYINYSKYLILQRIIMVSIAIPFYFIFGTDGVLIGIALSFLPFIFIIYKDFRQPINISFMKSKFKNLLNVYLMDIITLSRGSLDKLIIVPLLGFSLLGNYQLGLQFIVILNIIPMAIYQYVLSHDSSGLPTTKLKILAVSISGLLAIVGALLAPFVVPMLFLEFTESIQIVQILSFSLIPGTITMMYISKFLGAEKPMYLVVGSIIFLTVQMIGIFGLKDTYGIYGVSFAMILGYLVEVLFFVLINKFVYKKIN